MKGFLRFVSDRKTESKAATIGIVIVLASLLPLFAGPNSIYLITLGMFGAILALGLNIFFGYCGQINFGVAGFFALGGYSVALLEKYLHLPFFVNLLLAILIAGVIIWIVSFCLLRLRHYSLGLGTLAFAMAVHTATSKGFVDITGGADGIDLAPLLVFGTKAGDLFYYYFLLVTVLLCYWVSFALRESRLGRAMIGIGQGEAASVSLGIDVNSVMLLALILNGLMASLAGGLYVKWNGWASPAYFDLMCSVVIVVGVVVGGTGSALGAIIGGMLMFILPHLLITFAKFQLLVYGAILAVFILFLPDGIVGGIRVITAKLMADRKND